MAHYMYNPNSQHMNMQNMLNPNTFSHNTTKEKSTKNETIKVCVRLRPLLSHEDAEFWIVDEGKNTISTLNSNYLYNMKHSSEEKFNVFSNKEKEIKKVLMDSVYSPQNFTFDRIYSTSYNSQAIYKETCRNITKSVISGYNGTIFMYGQTTSGKTFTMLGTPNSPGILPCALRDIFNMINKEKDPGTFSVHCSYIEIYNENLHDLLTDNNNLKLVDDPKYGVIVSGAKRIKIKNFEDGITLKDFGEENRKYRETLINEYSSRSHTIFQIFVESEYKQENNPDSEGVRYSCLNLVDLAGSERLNDYDNKTEAFGETGHINKSLFVLANVVNKLAEGKNNYIPYRDSKLTRLLSQALGGNSLTAVICTVSPAAVNYYQTLSTMRFATRAKIVKTKATLNEYLDDKGAIEFYKSEIKKLQDELKKNTGGSAVNSAFNTAMQFYPSTNGNKSEVNNFGNFVTNDPNLNILLANNPQLSQMAQLFHYTNKELLDHIVKTNEKLTNELQSYKEMYLSEKEKNEAFRNEMDKFKQLSLGMGMNNINMNNQGQGQGMNSINSMNPSNNMNSINPMNSYSSFNPTGTGNNFHNQNGKIENLNFDYNQNMNSLNLNNNQSQNINQKPSYPMNSNNNFGNMNNFPSYQNQNHVSPSNRNINSINSVMNQSNQRSENKIPRENSYTNQNQNFSQNSNLLNNLDLPISNINNTNKNPNTNNNTITSIYENSYLKAISTKITPHLEKYKNYTHFKEETENMTSEYAQELINLQNQYRDRLKDTCLKLFPPSAINTNPELSSILKVNSINNTFTLPEPIQKEINSSFNSGNEKMFSKELNSLNSIESNDDRDDILRKIKSNSIFQEIRFLYTPNSYDNFEKNLKALKKVYEDRVDSLEKNMDYFKTYLENFYRKKIQMTRNNHIDNMNMDFMSSSESLPIMNITAEHNDKLKTLRDLYDAKLKELEQTFFDNLKMLTASRMNKSNLEV